MEKKLLVTIILVVIASLSIAGCTSSPSVSPTPTAAASSANSPTPSATQTQASPTSAPTTPQVTVATPAQIAALPTTPPANLQSYAGPFVGSINSNVYHYPWCFEAKKILAKNLVIFPTVANACAAGYRPCEECKPPACLPTPTPTPTPTPSQTYEVQISGDVSSNHTGYFFATVTNQAGVSQTLNWQINWFLNGQLAGGTWTPSGGITVPLTPGVQYTVTATYLTPAQWPNVGSTLATSAPFYVTG